MSNEQPTLEELVAKVKESLLAEEASIRPQRWSKYTVAPYFKLEYAKEILPALERMLVDKEHDQLFLVTAAKVSKSTLYQKISQAFRFVCENMDPEGKFKELKELTELRRDRQGVRIAWKFRPKFFATASTSVEPVIASEHAWQAEFEDFLNKAEEGHVFEKKINISRNDLDYIMAHKSVLEERNFHIIGLNSKYIKIVKMDLNK